MIKNEECSWIGVPKDISKYQGFVYRITNLMNGRMYIGKKFFWSKKALPPLKGNKRKRRTVVESNWKDYYGSCKELLEDIDKYGKENFKREIIALGKTKFDCAYVEANLQFERGVLFKKEYYNGIINCRLKKQKFYM